MSSKEGIKNINIEDLRTKSLQKNNTTEVKTGEFSKKDLNLDSHQIQKWTHLRFFFNSLVKKPVTLKTRRKIPWRRILTAHTHQSRRVKWMHKWQAELTFSTVARKANWISMGQNLYIYNEDYFVLLSVSYNLPSCKNSTVELDNPKCSATDDA